MTALSPTTKTGMTVRGLSVRRGGKTVVQDVSLSARPGEILGLIGPNGAGKSSTFHALIGLIESQADMLQLNGEDIRRLPMFQRARRGLGYLPQEASIFHGLSVQDTLRAIMEIALPRKERAAHLVA